MHARSGDKGGDANIGLWVRAGERQAERAAWLRGYLTADEVRDLVPEAEGSRSRSSRCPTCTASTSLVRGLLGDGVAASTRFDPQAKGLGEWVRSRLVNIPEALL